MRADPDKLLGVLLRLAARWDLVVPDPCCPAFPPEEPPPEPTPEVETDEKEDEDVAPAVAAANAAAAVCRLDRLVLFLEEVTTTPENKYNLIRSETHEQHNAHGHSIPECY